MEVGAICSSCGCNRPWDTHQDARNIVFPQLQEAAKVAGIPLDVVIENLAQAVEQSVPEVAFMAQLAKPLVVCDIDGVLADWGFGAVAAVNAKYGEDYGYDDITDRHDWLPKKQQKWFDEYRESEDYYRGLAPAEDAIAALGSLRDAGYRVWVVSDRSPDLADVSNAWLDRWGVPREETHIQHGYKAMLASQASPVDPVAFIDDNPRHVKDLPGPGRTLYLLRRPWNLGAGDGVEGVRPVATWLEVLAALPIQSVG